MIPRTVLARAADFEARAEVTVDGTVHVTVAGDPGAHGPQAAIALTYLGHGRFRVTDGDRTALAYAVDDGDLRWVFVDGDVFHIEIEAAGSRPRARPRGGHESLSAPMPATVVRVLVEPGDVVARGATLVVLEAMKMELPLRAPHDAVVEAVTCAEGDLVQAGIELVVLEARSEP
jgi:3-methylcrotonyl-CoA carboxylase alpha subunit